MHTFDGDLQILSSKEVYTATYNWLRDMEVAVVMVAPLRYNLELYIDASVKN